MKIYVTHLAHSKFTIKLAEFAFVQEVGMKGVGISLVGVEATGLEERVPEREVWRQTSLGSHSSMKGSAPE